jgi:hypothetical protein
MFGKALGKRNCNVGVSISGTRGALCESPKRARVNSRRMLVPVRYRLHRFTGLLPWDHVRELWYLESVP